MLKPNNTVLVGCEDIITEADDEPDQPGTSGTRIKTGFFNENKRQSVTFNEPISTHKRTIGHKLTIPNNNDFFDDTIYDSPTTANPKSPNFKPNGIRKQLVTRKDRVAVQFLNFICNLTPEVELITSTNSLASSPLAAPVDFGRSEHVPLTKTISIPLSSRTFSAKLSFKDPNSSSSSSSSDEEDGNVTAKNSQTEEVPLLSHSRKSSFLMENGPLIEALPTQSTSIKPIFAESFSEVKPTLSFYPVQDKFMGRSRKSSKVFRSKTKTLAYSHLLDPSQSLTEDPPHDYDPMSLDDPRVKLEAKTNLYTIISDIWSHLTPAGSDDADATFQSSHPTVDFSLTLAMIRQAKEKLFTVATSIDLELSSLALSYAYFEKLCLGGQVNRDNRRIVSVSCLFLAVKVNEHKNVLANLVDALDRVLDVGNKEIYANEFDTFAKLEFNLFVPQHEFLPHLKRILTQKGYINIESYLGTKTFYKWADS